MAFKQPRVPEFNEKDGASRYLKTLVLFLKDFCQEAWVANRQSAKSVPEIDYPVTSVNGKTGDVELSAADVGALGSGETAKNASKFNNATWEQMLKTVYPIGAIYLSVSDISPASLFGGTWERLKDRFLLGAGDSYAAGSTGGEATHKLTADELPKITDDFALRGASSTYASIVGSNTEVFRYENESNNASTFALSGSGCITRLTMSFGGDQPHNNMPPYLAVYMWVRVS